MTLGIVAEILRLFPEERGFAISVVGSGGKTTLMRLLSECLTGLVVCTTSTKLAESEAKLFDAHITWEEEDQLPPRLPLNGGSVLVTGESFQVKQARKLNGLTYSQLTALKQICDQRGLPLIIEADGSKRRPLKAPEVYEPVIPDFTDLVIVVIGLAGFMKPLNEENVFRSQIFSELTGLPMNKPVDLESILRYLKHPTGGLKGIPPTAKRFVMFNLFDCDCLTLIDREVVEKTLGDFYDSVVWIE